jgi:short-subunit dehydrogenase
MKKILVAGNKEFGLSKEISLVLSKEDLSFASRGNGYDFSSKVNQIKFADESVKFDIIILCSALHKFNQTVLLDTVYKRLVESKVKAHIICIGSTTDRVKNGKVWLYNAEKKALRDYCNTLGITGVWNEGPKITLISFGSLSNVKDKHPSRNCLEIRVAAEYVKWVIDQPKSLCINEISIDPMQNKEWYE